MAISENAALRSQNQSWKQPHCQKGDVVFIEKTESKGYGQKVKPLRLLCLKISNQREKNQSPAEDIHGIWLK